VTRSEVEPIGCVLALHLIDSLLFVNLKTHNGVFAIEAIEIAADFAHAEGHVVLHKERVAILRLYCRLVGFLGGSKCFVREHLRVDLLHESCIFAH